MTRQVILYSLVSGTSSILNLSQEIGDREMNLLLHVPFFLCYLFENAMCAIIALKIRFVCMPLEAYARDEIF